MASAAKQSTCDNLKQFFIPLLRSTNEDHYLNRHENGREVHPDDNPMVSFVARFCPLRGTDRSVWGTLLAVGNEDGYVNIIDVDEPYDRSVVTTIQADVFSVVDLGWSVSLNGQLVLLTAGSDGDATLYSVKHGEFGKPKNYTTSKIKTLDGDEQTIPEHGTGSITCVALNQNVAGVCVTGCEHGQVCVWNQKKGMYSPMAIINRAHPEKGDLAATRWELVVRLTCDPFAGCKQYHPSQRNETVTSVLLIDENLLLSAGKGTPLVVKLWNLKKVKKRSAPVELLFPVPAEVTSLSMRQNCPEEPPSPASPSACDSLFYVSCRDDAIYCFNYKTQHKVSKPLYCFVGHKVDSDYIRISVSPCGLYLASGSSDCRVYLWCTNPALSPGGLQAEGEDGLPQIAPLARLSGHSREVTCVDWGHFTDQPMLVSVSDDCTHRIWRVKSASSQTDGADQPMEEAGESSEARVEVRDTEFAQRFDAAWKAPHMPQVDYTAAKSKQSEQEFSPGKLPSLMEAMRQADRKNGGGFFGGSSDGEGDMFMFGSGGEDDEEEEDMEDEDEEESEDDFNLVAAALESMSGGQFGGGSSDSSAEDCSEDDSSENSVEETSD